MPCRLNEFRVVKVRLCAIKDDFADVEDDERKAIISIVQKAIEDASHRTTREMKETAVIVCGPEADLAHKIQEEMDKKRAMLIANLSAMQ